MVWSASLNGKMVNSSRFLADRTNGRAIATLFRLSVRLSVCRL